MIQFIIFRCDILRGEAEHARQSRSKASSNIFPSRLMKKMFWGPTHSTISDKSRKTLRLPILPAPAFRLPNLPFLRELNLLFSKELHLPFSREFYLPSRPPLKRSHNNTKLNPSHTSMNKFRICSSLLTQNSQQFELDKASTFTTMACMHGRKNKAKP